MYTNVLENMANKSITSVFLLKILYVRHWRCAARKDYDKTPTGKTSCCQLFLN